MNWKNAAGNEAISKKKGSCVEIALFLNVTPCCLVEMIESFRGS